MSLTASLNNALTGLAAAQRSLAVISDNVANVNTPGYTRKIVPQEAQVLSGDGAGVRTGDSTRVVDRFLQQQLRQQQGQQARQDALSAVHDRIQGSVLGAPGDTSRGLANRLNELSSAAEALATAPEDTALAAGLVAAVDDLLAHLRGDAAQVQALRRDADQGIGDTVAAINSDLRSLHEINVEIARSGATAALADRRDALIGTIGAEIEISTHNDESGTASVYTRGGIVLLESRPALIEYRPAATVAAGTTFGAVRVFQAKDVDPVSGEPLAGAAGQVLVTGGVRAELTPELAADAVSDGLQTVVSPFRSGRLQGLIEARDQVLPELADQIAELGSATAHVLNKAHNQGVPLPLPTTLAGTRTDLSGFAAATRSGTAHLAVVDPRDGAVVQLVTVDLTATSAADLVAQIDAGLGPLGDAAIDADGRLQITLANPSQGLAIAGGDGVITTTDVAGRSRSYGFAHYFGLNDLVVENAAGTGPALRAEVAADAGKLSRVAMSIVAGPPVSATVGGAGDARPARALAAALQEQTALAARGGLPARSASLGNYAADIVAKHAVEAKAATARAEGTAALVENIETRVADVSGVNLDEELSRLLAYQQAYTVSARIISITDQLFDDLLAIKQ